MPTRSVWELFLASEGRCKYSCPGLKSAFPNLFLLKVSPPMMYWMDDGRAYAMLGSGYHLTLSLTLDYNRLPRSKIRIVTGERRLIHDVIICKHTHVYMKRSFSFANKSVFCTVLWCAAIVRSFHFCQK